MIYLILGYSHKNEIHPILKKRLDLFIKLYKIGDKVILSGGNPNKNAHTEAFMMSQYLRQTIPKKDIIIENKSVSTKENINFSLKFITKTVTLITSSWHMKRVKRIVKNLEKNNDIKFLFRSSRVLPANKEESLLIKNEKINII
jgi:uncharacterized SAM-binding protein YcdF (DUF218 family)